MKKQMVKCVGGCKVVALMFNKVTIGLPRCCVQHNIGCAMHMYGGRFCNQG